MSIRIDEAQCRNIRPLAGPRRREEGRDRQASIRGADSPRIDRIAIGPLADPETARVCALVARARGISMSALLQRSRGRAPVALSRQIAMYLSHVVLGRTLSDIGARFGRDRTTVAHACALVEDLRDNAAFESMIAELEALIGECAQ